MGIPLDVRSEILSVATRRFARAGYSGTSLQVIAEEVGVRKPSLLHHFTSKEELLRAVLDNLFEHWTETLPRLLEAVTSGRGRFEAMSDELITFLSEDPDRARLIIREMMDRPEEMRARLATTLRPWVRLIADYIRQSQNATHAHAEVDPESYILNVVTMMISGIASLPVLADAIPGEPELAQARYMKELRRIARVSLFADGQA